MNVLEAYFDAGVNQCSPVQVDIQRVPVYDEDGNEFVTYEPIDYPAIQASYGVVKDWSLTSLLKAGINPNFSIHTGNPTRMEGLGDLDAMNLYLDSILAEGDGSKE